MILSPKESGEALTPLKWRTSNLATTKALSKNDGLLNTQTLITAGIHLHPAANFCHNLVIDGYDDWYLPSMDELEMCYRAFKPSVTLNDLSGSLSNDGKAGYNPSSVPIGTAYTASSPGQTTHTTFQLDGAEAFKAAYYWTSTDYNTWNARIQHFVDGNQRLGNKDNSTIYVRAVRRQRI